MCFVEVIDTAGQGVSTTTISNRSHVMTVDIQRNMPPYGTSGSGAIPNFPPPLEHGSFYPPAHREGQGFILVYSIASRATFERLEVFRQAMLKVKRHRPVFMLVGNKCDKQYEREVSREEGAAMARDFGCRFLETSAKTAQNVEKLFTDLVRLLRSSKESVDRGVPAPPPPTKPPKPPMRLKCVVL
jgi:GTPase SAR1 family protein